MNESEKWSEGGTEIEKETIRISMCISRTANDAQVNKNISGSHKVNTHIQTETVEFIYVFLFFLFRRSRRFSIQ